MIPVFGRQILINREVVSQLFVFYLQLNGFDSPFTKVYNHAFKIGTKWYIENCPTTLGQPCPVCDSNSELWNTGVKENQEIVRRRKRVLRYISNIIVLSDTKHPENEGKVFLFKYGAKIFTKLMNAIKPEFEDEKSFDPFNFWEGAPFKLKIRDVEGYRNYDKSEFGECCPLFDQDEAMEKVWNSQYKLNEFTELDQFKPYEELKTKFLSVINSNNNQSSKPKQDDDGEDDSQGFDQKEEVRNKPSNTVNKNKANTSEDDDLELFRNMIDD